MVAEKFVTDFQLCCHYKRVGGISNKNSSFSHPQDPICNCMEKKFIVILTHPPSPLPSCFIVCLLQTPLALVNDQAEC